jgi:hypothetical protein
MLRWLKGRSERCSSTCKRFLRDLLAGARNYLQAMRRVLALVEVDGQEREMEFLTNNLSWSASSVADLYRCRWQIEVFFKQIKQSLQLCDFLGNSANAVRLFRTSRRFASNAMAQATELCGEPTFSRNCKPAVTHPIAIETVLRIHLRQPFYLDRVIVLR